MFAGYNLTVKRALLVAAVILIACQAVGSLAPLPTLTTRPSPTAIPVTSQPTLALTPTTTPTEVPEVEYSVRLHPDGPLYIGDRISIEVISPEAGEPDEKKVQIQVGGEAANDLGSSGFEEHGIGGRLQATFDWVWDTSDLEAGDYQIEFSVQPDGPMWTETVNLLPAVKVPSPEPVARWETFTLDCCVVNYISGTDFAQEAPDLQALIQEQAEMAEMRMGGEFDQRIPITILPRVLGHGGFASSEIYVSYLEDNYAGNDLSQVLHHEMIHILDRQLGGELRPSLLVEGLAVHLSDGHFKKEPLLPRAAVLLDLGWYLPLTELANSFYTSQHEIGYLEGGALVEFMVNQYGWQAFNDFYRDIKPHSSGDQSMAINRALFDHFGLTLRELESKFKSELYRRHINPDMYTDVILTVNYYEAVRRYQRLLDPSAYFLTAWLPDGGEMRERGIVADYLRRPSTQQNLVIEDLLVEVDLQLRAGNYREAEKALKQVERELGLIQNDVLIGASHLGETQIIGLGADY
jgi:hypothetical protein